MTDIRAKIRQFILNEFLPGESPEQLKDDIPLRKSGIIDSMGLLQTINFIETEFDIEVGALEGDNINFGTIENIVAFVQKKLQMKI